MADRLGELVFTDLGRRGLDPRLGSVPDEVLVGEERLGLTNLRQVCAQLPDADWPAAVARHFDQVLASHHEELPADWTVARPNLRIRIYGAADMLPADSLVAWALADDLRAVLVYDLPTTLFNVTPQALEPWAQTRDAVWGVALENMSREQAPQVAEVGDAQLPLVVIEGESYYTATNVLWLDRYLPLDPACGALVALPTRHVVVAHAIHDLRTATAMGPMLFAGRRAYDQGPGSISDQLYWWRPGRLTRIPSDRAQNSVTPPDELIQLLNSLPAAP